MLDKRVPAVAQTIWPVPQNLQCYVHCAKHIENNCSHHIHAEKGSSADMVWTRVSMKGRPQQWHPMLLLAGLLYVLKIPSFTTRCWCAHILLKNSCQGFGTDIMLTYIKETYFTFFIKVGRRYKPLTVCDVHAKYPNALFIQEKYQLYSSYI